MQVSLRPHAIPVIKRMEQLAEAEAKEAALAALSAAKAAERMAKIRIVAAAITSKKSPEELIRTRAAEAIARAEASLPSRRPLGTISTDLAPRAQEAELHRARYFSNTCTRRWGNTSVEGRPSPGSFKK